MDSPRKTRARAPSADTIDALTPELAVEDVAPPQSQAHQAQTLAPGLGSTTAPSASTSASASASASASTSPLPSPLLSTLNRLSHATSRPNLPPPAGYASRTLRTMSGSLQALVWGEAESAHHDSSGTEEARNDDGLRRLSLSPVPSPARAPVDTSALLYPTLQNHPAPLAHPLLVLDLAALTRIPASVPNDELLAALLRRLEPWVGEEGEGGYCLVVLAAEDADVRGPSAGKARSLPGVGWWMWHWRRIPRKYRKNLKRLYIVHPSAMTRAVLPILIPLVSPKSYAKLHTVPSLLGLARRGVSLAGIDLPLATLMEEARVLREDPNAANPHANAYGHAAGVLHAPAAGWWGSVTSLLPWGEAPVALPAAALDDKVTVAAADTPYWSEDIDVIVERDEGRVPRALRDLTSAILLHCTSTEGIFRRSAYTSLANPIRAFLDLPLERQPRIDWQAVAAIDPLLPPIMYKRLLGGLAAPIIPASLYPAIRRTHTAEEIRSNILAHLSPARAALLDHTAHFLHHLLAYPATRMNALGLAIVVSPNLIAGDPREDAMLCIEPGRAAPPIPGMASLHAAMADSDSEGSEAETEGTEGTEEGAKHSVSNAPPAPAPVVQNTLVGVMQTYITDYLAVNRLNAPGATCGCAMPATGALSPTGAARAPASPRKGAWVLGEPRPAPPIES